MAELSTGIVEIGAAMIFIIALVHTFSTQYFQRLAHHKPAHAGLWHLLGEVEVVFGFWAMVLLIFLVFHSGKEHAVGYLESRNFTEPAFVFVIMVIAGSRPIIDFGGALLHFLSRAVPLSPPLGYYATVLSIGPLLGSFITEPAAMTLSALLLRQRFFSRNAPSTFMYATVGVLFVNISIGGTLTPYAAPPVLMVADKWGYDISTMLTTFGWKAAIAVFINAGGAAYLFRDYLNNQPTVSRALATMEVPAWTAAVHVAFLAGVVIFAHHAPVFIALFLFFLGFTEAYKRYQSRLMLREGLLVAFFLAGLIVLGGQQRWWLGPLLGGMEPTALYFGTTLLTAITDNAALTYLGSLVDGVSESFKYSMVAGAVTGGGLTVIANAPNPAGFAILKDSFEEGTISAMGLLAAAALPTLVAIGAFQLLPG